MLDECDRMATQDVLITQRAASKAKQPLSDELLAILHAREDNERSRCQETLLLSKERPVEFEKGQEPRIEERGKLLLSA